jgi:hypothetical protein
MKKLSKDKPQYSFIEAFTLIKSNLPIYLVSLAFGIVSLRLIHLGLLLVLLLPLLTFAWSGTKLALLRDSYLQGKAKWNRFSHYMWKYLKRLFPLLLIFFAATPILNGIILFTFRSPTGLIARVFPFLIYVLPAVFFTPLITLIVIEDIGVFKGALETFKLINNNIRFFFILLCLFSANYLLTRLINPLISTEVLQNSSGIENAKSQALILSPVSTFIGFFLDSFTLVYLSKKIGITSLERQ